MAMGSANGRERFADSGSEVAEVDMRQILTGRSGDDGPAGEQGVKPARHRHRLSVLTAQPRHLTFARQSRRSHDPIPMRGPSTPDRTDPGLQVSSWIREAMTKGRWEKPKKQTDGAIGVDIKR